MACDPTPGARPRVLLVLPPILLPEVFIHYPTFANLGALYNAALLEQEGFSVALVDSFFHEPHLNLRAHQGPLRHLGLELPALADALKAQTADVVVLVLTMYSDVRKLEETYVGQTARLVAQALPGVPLVAADCYVSGGNYFAYDPRALLDQVPELDAVVPGEGDFKLCEVLTAYAKGEPPTGLGGVTFRTPDGPVTNPGTYPLVKTLDELPPPAFHLLNLEHYFQGMEDAVRADLVHEYHDPRRFLPLLTSRGCPFSCCFCTQQVLAPPWRGHSNAYLEALLPRLRQLYQVDTFLFLDSNINVHRRRFKRLAQFLASSQIPWDAVNGFRADLLDEEDLGLIQQAGNRKLTISAESGDPQVLKEVVGKRLALDKVVQVAQTCARVGLPAQVHFVIGLPGETRVAINRTLEFAASLQQRFGTRPLLQHAIPFRGTRLYLQCQQQGWFDVHPDTLPLHEPEWRPLIRTPQFSPDQILRFKRSFGALMEARQEWFVLTLPLGDNNRNLLEPRPDSVGPRDLDRGQLLGLLEGARGRGAQRLLLRGGEPLLKADLVRDLFRGARALGFRQLTLATNGRMLVYRRLVDQLLEAGLEAASVTLYSTEARCHDALTQVPGSLEETLQGLHNLKAAGLPRLELNLPLLQSALESLPASVETLLGLDPQALNLQSPIPIGPILEHLEELVPYPRLLPVLTQLLDAFPASSLGLQGLPPCLVQPRHRARVQPCPAHQLPLLEALKTAQEVCSGCPEYILCRGFWRDDLDPLFGQ